jgi:hypothetical protein
VAKTPKKKATKAPKPRATKYDGKLQVNASFEELDKALVTPQQPVKKK